MEVDLQGFEKHAQVGTPEALATAAALYSGEFMAGVYLDECPEFEVWLVTERERWRQKIVSVLECMSRYFARKGEHLPALTFAGRLLELEPWREEGHRQMMELFARTGQHSAALVRNAQRCLAFLRVAQCASCSGLPIRNARVR